MTENIREIVEGQNTRYDSVSLLKLVRDQMRAAHADAIELGRQSYDTQEEALGAGRPLFQDFYANFDIEVADSVGGWIRTSSEGVSVANTTVEISEDDEKVSVTITLSKEEPLKKLDMFQSREGNVRGLVLATRETEDGRYRVSPNLVLEPRQKREVTLARLPGTDIPAVKIRVPELYYAELSEHTQIEYPTIEEIERYQMAVSSLAKKGIIKKRVLDKIHSLKAAFHQQDDAYYQELRIVPALRWVVRRCEELLQRHDDQDAPVCTDQEVAELLSTLINRSKPIMLVGDDTNGEEEQLIGVVVDVYVRRDNTDTPTIYLALEVESDDEDDDDADDTFIQSFAIRNLQELYF